MKVSILVPIYNTSQFIERCVISLLEQTYENIEYIFVNDCSSDNSISILKDVLNKYPRKKEHVRLINNHHNEGIAKVRNILINNATGKYIYFVDSDDYIDKNAVEILISTALKYKSDIVRYNYYEVYNGKRSSVISNEPFINKEQLLKNAISSQSGIDSMWKLFIKRELFTSNGLQFTIGINGCEDYIMSIKLFYYAHKITDISNALYYYTVIGNTNSITKDAIKFIVDRMNAISEIYRFMNEENFYEQYKQYLYLRIILCKQAYLINKHNLDLKKYQSFFPEANKAWRNLKYGTRERILFWLAEHNFFILIKIYYFLR